MKLNEYQEATRATVVYPAVIDVPYLCLGLGGETGEVLDIQKKWLRGDYEIRAAYLTDMTNEMGDLLWCLARLADEIGVPLETIALANLAKLESRQERGTLQGNGNNR